MSPVVRFVALPFVAIALTLAAYCYALVEFTAATLATSTALILYLLIASAFKHRNERRRGWRFVARGRDNVRYEELVDGRWIGFDFYAELLVGRPSRVLGIWDEQTWPSRTPEWASNRRAEIVTRIGQESKRLGYAMEVSAF